MKKKLISIFLVMIILSFCIGCSNSQEVQIQEISAQEYEYSSDMSNNSEIKIEYETDTVEGLKKIYEVEGFSDYFLDILHQNPVLRSNYFNTLFEEQSNDSYYLFKNEYKLAVFDYAKRNLHTFDYEHIYLTNDFYVYPGMTVNDILNQNYAFAIQTKNYVYSKHLTYEYVDQMCEHDYKDVLILANDENIMIPEFFEQASYAVETDPTRVVLDYLDYEKDFYTNTQMSIFNPNTGEVLLGLDRTSGNRYFSTSPVYTVLGNDDVNTSICDLKIMGFFIKNYMDAYMSNKDEHFYINVYEDFCRLFGSDLVTNYLEDGKLLTIPVYFNNGSVCGYADNMLSKENDYTLFILDITDRERIKGLINDNFFTYVITYYDIGIGDLYEEVKKQ